MIYRRQALQAAVWSLTSLMGAAPAGAITAPRKSLYQLDVPLTDQDGHKSSWRDAPPPQFNARIVSMFYSNCDMVCPMLFESIRVLESGLPKGAATHLQVSLVTLDPERDDVAALKKALANRGGDAQRWKLYRTELRDVRKIAGLLGVQYRKLSSGEFNHSTPIILLDKQGVEVARTEQIAKADPVFAKAVKQALATALTTSAS